MSNFLIQTWVHSCYLHLQSLTASPWKWCLEDDPLLSGRKIIQSRWKNSSNQHVRRVREIPVCIYISTNVCQNWHAKACLYMIYILLLRVYVHIYIYICTWYWCTQCKSKQYTVYTHMYILYKYKYIYAHILCDYTTIFHQWLHKHHGSFKQHHGPETATGRGPNVHEQQRRHSCTASMLQNANLGWWQPEFP